MERVLISSCLLGLPVRYHGGGSKVESGIIDHWLKEGRVVSLCPEVRGRLGVPRAPAEIIGANGFSVLDRFAAVLDIHGTDITSQMEAGAYEALETARSYHIRVAVLKDGSPSCGRTFIYNGQFRNIKKRGETGVTAALLLRNGISVFNEHQISDAALRLRELESNLRVGA